MKTAISVVIAGMLIGVAILYSAPGAGSGGKASAPSVDNVSVAGGVQIVEIGVKGGYSPRATVAQAGIPTVLRMKTNNTYDCSSALSIPSIGYRAYLPASGETNIDVPAQKSGAVLEGICAMGMYHFSVAFD